MKIVASLLISLVLSTIVQAQHDGQDREGPSLVNAVATQKERAYKRRVKKDSTKAIKKAAKKEKAAKKKTPPPFLIGDPEEDYGSFTCGCLAPCATPGDTSYGAILCYSRTSTASLPVRYCGNDNDCSYSQTSYGTLSDTCIEYEGPNFSNPYVWKPGCSTENDQNIWNVLCGVEPPLP